MLRLSIFNWNIIVTMALIMFSFPALTAALVMLFIDRSLGGGFFAPASGGDPVLYQHLFWFFGHPEVYIIILPFFGIISEVVPVFSRKPLFGYRLMIFSLVLIAAYTGIKFFNWIATMWRGQLTFPPPMMWALGMMYVFLVGGITGVIIA